MVLFQKLGKNVNKSTLITTLFLAVTTTSVSAGTKWDNMTHDERVIQAKRLGEGIGKGLLFSKTMATKEMGVADSNLREKCSEVANKNTLFLANENAANYMNYVVSECINVVSENDK